MTFFQNLKEVLSGPDDAGMIREVRSKLDQRPQLSSDQFAETYFPEEKRSVAKRLMEITKEHSVADITGLVPEDAFVADLRMDDLDSLCIVEFIVHLEKEFYIDLPDNKIKGIRTFSELLDVIIHLQNEKV
jgi:acyl carrier protein